jgi:Cu2+-exporting ATPase
LTGAVGFVSITDAIKATSVETIKLIRQGVEVIMLTGDNENTAKAVAQELHLSSIKRMFARRQVKRNKKIASRREIVAMAGDGINDAQLWRKPMELRWELPNRCSH